MTLPKQGVVALCGRMMVGSGGDTYDPICELPAGHRGSCKSTSAVDQHRITLVGRIYRDTDPRGGPQRIVVVTDTGGEKVGVENDHPPYRPRKLARRRLYSAAYEFIGLTPATEEALCR